jgi:uncharacterized protein (DUF1330 family)
MDHIDPDKEAWAVFKSMPRDRPIQMLNLIRLRPIAAYPEGHANFGEGLTGLDAYLLYAETTAPILRRLGARVVWSGQPQLMLTGPQDEAWDIAFVAEYPTADAFIAMVRDPEYRVHVLHRTAATADSRLVRTDPRKVSDRFWS